MQEKLDHDLLFFFFFFMFRVNKSKPIYPDRCTSTIFTQMAMFQHHRQSFNPSPAMPSASLKLLLTDFKVFAVCGV